MALFEFKLPDLGEGVVEGEIVKWLVKAGDAVKEDQTLVEVMTDKATVSVPSPVAGTIIKTYGNEGEIARVHHRLADVEVAGAAPKQPNAHAPVAVEAAKAAPVAAAAAPKSHEKVLATPVTRKIASEHGIDLSTVAGTGPQGRVLKSDVEAVISGGGAPAPVAARPAQTFAPLASTQADQRIPMRGMRKRMRQRFFQHRTVGQSGQHIVVCKMSYAFLVIPAFDRDAGKVRCHFSDAQVLAARRARFDVIHRKRPEDLSLRRQDRRRPACSQLVLSGHRPIVYPQRIELNGADDDRLAGVHRGAARTRTRADRLAVDGPHIFLRQVRRRHRLR